MIQQNWHDATMIRNATRESWCLLRRYKEVASIRRFVATAPFQLESSLSIFDPERFTFPNPDQERWDSLVRNFTRILFTQDVSAIFKQLAELERQCTSLYDTVKTRQMQMLEFFQGGLYMYIEAEKRHNVKEVIAIAQAYADFIKRAAHSGIDKGLLHSHIDTILTALLQAFHLERECRKSQIFLPPIKSIFNQVVKEFEVDLSLFFIQLTHEHLKKSLETLNLGTAKLNAATAREPESISFIPIDPYLDAFGNLYFDKACKYISENKFQWKGEPVTCKIYDVYDNLPQYEKEDFLLEYLEFNKIKQSTLEHYTHKLIKSASHDNATSKQSAKFILHEHKMIKTWVKLSCDKVQLSIVDAPASEEEKVLYHFRQFVEAFPISTMVSNIIHKLISSVYLEKVGVVEIFSSMRTTFKRDVSLMKKSDHKSQLFKFISDDDFDKLSSILVKSVIESCMILRVNAEGSDADDVASGFTNEDFAFHLDTIYVSPVKSETVINFNPVLKQKVTSIPVGSNSHHFPLLCPPEPWLGVNKGAYMERNTPFLSGFDQLQHRILQNAQHLGKLDSAFKCLDQMGQTAWAINPDVLLVFNQVMELPNGFLDIPPKHCDESTKSKQEIIDIKGLRLNFETVNMLANTFDRNGDMLYHCYVFDFRGRVYPLSPLTHYGGDLTRSLFQFWYGQPLGVNGFYWVKYQLMSVFGNETDCEKFYNHNKEQILASASDPLHNHWWMKADEPFSALSVCIEIQKILQFVQHGKGSIEEYICRLPIHQDGSCNGLQHYAALAADELGGKAVNLVPMDTKQDVYSTVKDIVEQKIIADVENRLMGEDRDHAAFMLKILDRKLIKRPVMTTVYGVTLAGASRQILENIEDVVSDYDENPTKRGLYDEVTIDRLRQFNLRSTMYLARKILSSIDELFFNAKQMEKWLVENTRRILTSYNVKTLDYLQLRTFTSASLTSSLASKALNNWYKTPISYSPISWISASGFPVIQTYRKRQQPHSVTGALGSIMQLALNKTAPMDRRKHELAIAPNFIHSLDASHMFMTCDACAEASAEAEPGSECGTGPGAGLIFASIHDSYWTHPNHVEKLSRILRQTFVKLHSFDYMTHVRNDFVKQVQKSYCFQLVYFDKMEYRELYAELRAIRKTYGDYNNDNSKKVSDLLSLELRQLHKQKQDHPVSQLLKTHDPKLYHIVGNYIHKYTNDIDNNADGSSVGTLGLLRKNLVPVFVPLRILNLPKKGTLDITQVLDSKYFFS